MRSEKREVYKRRMIKHYNRGVRYSQEEFGWSHIAATDNAIQNISTVGMVNPHVDCAVQCLMINQCLSFAVIISLSLCQLYGSLQQSTKIGIHYKKMGRFPASCSEAASCGAGADGEYWLVPQIEDSQNPMKIYCHDIRNTPKEYITLKEKNYIGKKPRFSPCMGLGFRGFFYKIGIDLQTMLVVKNDFKFSTANPDGYSAVFDCTGHFSLNCIRASSRIDLRHSGFKLQNDTTVTLTGTDASVLRFDVESNAQVVNIVCGGLCASCGIRDIRLEHHGLNVSDDGTSTVLCLN